MRFEKRPRIDFAPGEHRLLRYTIVAVSAVTLVGTIVFMIWVLGQVIGALHAWSSPWPSRV
jgi:hypothetical protein